MFAKNALGLQVRYYDRQQELHTLFEISTAPQNGLALLQVYGSISKSLSTIF